MRCVYCAALIEICPQCLCGKFCIYIVDFTICGPVHIIVMFILFGVLHNFWVDDLFLFFFLQLCCLGPLAV